MQTLKYLFTVVYKDGSIFCQNEQDVSVTDPKRSAFFDVRISDVHLFNLVGHGKVTTVSISEGWFEINGSRFSLHPDTLPSDIERRLIFFRKHKHGFNSAMQEVSHTVTYQLGWQCTHEGKNHQFVIEFD